MITVVIPEFVTDWKQQWLRNQTALALKARLLYRPNTVVTSVPVIVDRESRPERMKSDDLIPPASSHPPPPLCAGVIPRASSPPLTHPLSHVLCRLPLPPPPSSLPPPLLYPPTPLLSPPPPPPPPDPRPIVLPFPPPPSYADLGAGSCRSSQQEEVVAAPGRGRLVDRWTSPAASRGLRMARQSDIPKA